MDFLPHDQVDNRRLEVVADGFSVHSGAQLAIDTTLVSPLAGDGSVKRGVDRTDGAALIEARRRKERTRANLVVLVVEVGGRWFQESRQSSIALASAKALSAPFLLRSKRKRLASRWSCLVCCTAATSFGFVAARWFTAGVDGSTPSVHEVLGERRIVRGRTWSCIDVKMPARVQSHEC